MSCRCSQLRSEGAQEGVVRGVGVNHGVGGMLGRRQEVEGFRVGCEGSRVLGGDQLSDGFGCGPCDRAFRCRLSVPAGAR